MPLGGAQQVFFPGVDQAYRLSAAVCGDGALGGQKHRWFDLAAEAAADRGLDHPNRCLVPAQCRRHHFAHGVGTLGRDVYRHPVCFGTGEYALGLQVEVILVAGFGGRGKNLRSPGKGTIHIAVTEAFFKVDIVRAENRRFVAGQCFFHGADGRDFVVFDDRPAGQPVELGRIAADQQEHGFAAVLDAAGGEKRAGILEITDLVDPGYVGGSDLKITGRQFRDGDRCNGATAHRGAHGHRVEHVRNMQIVHVTGTTVTFIRGICSVQVDGKYAVHSGHSLVTAAKSLCTALPIASASPASSRIASNCGRRGSRCTISASVPNQDGRKAPR